MKKGKRGRLENKGWVVGGIKELLNLSAQEEARIELWLKGAKVPKATAVRAHPKN